MKRTSITRWLILGLLVAAPVSHADSWELVKDEDGIRVYLSEVPGSACKAYRGVVTVDAEPARITALQEDVEAACRWIHECQSQRLLKSDGDEAWTYTRFNAPWPVSPRDSVLHVRTERKADGTVIRHLSEAPDLVPAQKGYVRVEQVEGFWQLSPVAPGRTEIVYQLHTEPGGSVPSWLANKFVVESPFNTLKALREQLTPP